MQRRTLLLGLSSVTGLAACGGGGRSDSKFRPYVGPPITQVQIFKNKRVMMLFSDTEVVRRYAIALGGDPVGAKQFEGDGRTPEGLYFIDGRNPNSAYHLSLRISYPNANDIAYAQAHGRKPGGDIFIHGRGGRDYRRSDWTAGCVAVTDREIEDIFAMVRVGTPVFIYP